MKKLTLLFLMGFPLISLSQSISSLIELEIMVNQPPEVIGPVLKEKGFHIKPRDSSDESKIEYEKDFTHENVIIRTFPRSVLYLFHDSETFYKIKYEVTKYHFNLEGKSEDDWDFYEYFDGGNYEVTIVQPKQMSRYTSFGISIRLLK